MAFGSGAWAAGNGARPDGAAGPGIGWFTTNGVLDTVYAKIDGALWYSTGGAFTNISAGIGGTVVETWQTPSRDFIWAGSDAGVWVSFDRGATWQERNNGLTCLGTTHAQVTNSGTMYVSTRCNQVDAVFRSFDRGVTWQPMAALPGAPQVNRTQRAADITQSTIYVYTTKGSFRSSDTSTNWTADQALSGAPFRSVPAGSNVIEGYQSAKSWCVMLVRDVGPYRTENCPIGGTSQPAATLQTQGLPAAPDFGKRIGLVNNEQLIPVIGDGVYRFDTTSSSWVRAYPDAQVSGTVAQVPGIEYVRDIAAGSSTLLATSRTSGIWRSSDSGATWQPFGLPGSTSPPPQTLNPVTPPPQTSFSVPTGQLPEAAIASVEASNDIRSLTVVVALDLSKILGTPTQSFAAVSGYNVYVVAAVPGERLGSAAGTKVYYQRAATEIWGTLTSPIAAFVENVALGAADQRVTVEIVRDTDLSALIGTEIYIGYGTSDTEMLQAQRYRGVYIVN
jgi:hypothetical protein